MGVTFSIILDTRYLSKKSQTYPLKLRVTRDRKSRGYPTIFSLSEIDFNKINAPRLSEGLLKIKNSLKEIDKDLTELISKMIPFSFGIFERDYLLGNKLFEQKKLLKRHSYIPKDQKISPKIPEISATTNGETIIGLEKNIPADINFAKIIERYPILNMNFKYGEISYVYRQAIQRLAFSNCLGNADRFRDSYNNLAKYLAYDLSDIKVIKKKVPVPDKSIMDELTFSMINIDWLNGFENWMQKRGIRLASVGVNLRSLRTVFNDAIDRKFVDRDLYPFGKRRYQIPVSRKSPKTLKQEELKALYEYQPVCNEERFSLSFWFFMYFANGINPADLFHLKPSNIDGNYMSFFRIKVQRTQRSNPVLIRTYINSFMWDVIREYGDLSIKNQYIFPTIDNEMDFLTKYDCIKRKREFIYRWMRKIGGKLGIAIPLGPNLARHCAATNMKRSGLNHAYIQEALGHSDIRTTEYYLGSFEDETKQKQSKLLSNFLSQEMAETIS